MRGRRLWILVALTAAGVGTAAGAGARADDHQRLGHVRSKLNQAQGRLAHTQGRAQVLTTDISALTGRIRRLQAGITALQARQATIQDDLDAERAELLRLQGELRRAHAELARLRLRLTHSRDVLARRILELYEAEQPDIVSVVLGARNFAELLENSHYALQVGEQDNRIVEAVRTAKAATTKLVTRLRKLEDRQRVLTERVLRQRNAVARVRVSLQQRRGQFATARSARARTLGAVRASAAEIRQRVDFLKGEEATIERRIQAAQAAASPSPGIASAGPVQGSGQFIWPVNGPITSPFCESRAWESCHPGIDIGVPGGTPIRAAGAGKVILAGPTSGYGNYTCLQHTGSLSTCYAHQSSIGVHVGQSVGQGQVIGAVGCTGLCFGDHLHFEVRVNGSVVNPLSYL